MSVVKVIKSIGTKLNRTEMKRLMAGSAGTEGANCLHCYSSCGASCWYRRDTTLPANSECETIYPNCTIDDAFYDMCSTICTC